MAVNALESLKCHGFMSVSFSGMGTFVKKIKRVGRVAQTCVGLEGPPSSGPSPCAAPGDAAWDDATQRRTPMTLD